MPKRPEIPPIPIKTTLLDELIVIEFAQVDIFSNNIPIVLAKDDRNKIIEDDDKIIIEFHDSGNGFENHILEKAFVAFITTKEPGKGTGLGLWICKRIIDGVGGKIKLVNTNNGALVKVILHKG